MSELRPWELKRPASATAVDSLARGGMVLGLGTGNAANYAVDRIAEMAAAGASFECVASSVATEGYARSKGLDLVDIDSVDRVDVTFDGADEVDPELNMVKGLGGALLHEKILASISDVEAIIVDDIKLVSHLGTRAPLPVEICRYGHSRTVERLRALGCKPALRMGGGGVFVTDGGNLICDCLFGGISDPEGMQSEIDRIPGVVECGLFVGMADSVFVFHPDGARVERIDRIRD